jgi:hypothetical protein
MMEKQITRSCHLRDDYPDPLRINPKAAHRIILNLGGAFFEGGGVP